MNKMLITNNSVTIEIRRFTYLKKVGNHKKIVVFFNGDVIHK